MSQKVLKILLVNDDPIRRPLLRELIHQTDLARVELDHLPTKVARCGFRANYYNVCIIDSVDQAISLLEESRRVGFTTPMIVLTSNSAEDVIHAMRHGAADCLVRESLTAEALEESICVVIGSVRYREYRAECARRYSSLVENSSEIIYTHDLQGNSTFLSKAGEQLIGYTLEEIRNTNFSRILSPDCIEFVWSSVQRMLANRKPSSYEAVMVTKEGLRVPVAVTMHLVYRKGNPVEVQGIVRDLSSQTLPGPPPTAGGQFPRIILTL
jgi:PAS domain S-box-containing protein